MVRVDEYLADGGDDVLVGEREAEHALAPVQGDHLVRGLG